MSIAKPTTISQTVTVTVLYLAITASCVIACPSGCSCNAVTATCNNQKYTETPVGFSPTIETLYLYSNNITRIRSQTLQPLKNLKLLDLSGNQISDLVLWNGIFSNMKGLENLILQENRIAKISSKIFKGLKHLARIYLQHNRISIIEPGSFDNLPSLVELKLSHNRLGSFPVLSHTPNLLLLDLSFNRLGTIRDMAFSTVNLEYLRLQNNRLTELRTSIFDDTSKLTRLDIGNNRLTAVPQVIKSFTSLRYLNMSLNKVGTISKDTFKGMSRLKALDLHGMGLTDLPRGTIPERVILNRFDITDNDWNCGCGMRWLPEYMDIFHDAFIDPDTIKCSASSKLSGRKIKLLEADDFTCTEAEIADSVGPTSPAPRTPNLPSAVTTKPRWFPNPCEVYRCQHGGICYVEGRRPKCRCNRFWLGERCQISLTIPTASPTVRSQKSTTTRQQATVTSQKPKLLINKDSITDHSVEIILPVAERELDVTILEIGSHQRMTSQRIKPRAQPFTIEGLESGKTYNICIHLPTSSRGHDALCGLVHTESTKSAENPPATPKIRIVPSTNVESNDDTVDKNADPGYGDKWSSDGESPDTSQSADFKVIYPAVGAAVGAVIILSILVMFFVCYRHRKNKKLKGHNSSDYVPGAPMEPSLNDIEMATVVHHHHHNHYNANGGNANSKNGGVKTQKNQKFTNNNPSKSVTPQKSSSLSRNSVASSSNSGTVHSRFTDTPQHYQQQYMAPTPPNHPQYEPIQSPRGNGRNDFVFRPSNNMNNPAPIANMQCIPMNRHYEPEIVDDTQPMLTDMGQYIPYAHEDRRLHPDFYPANPRNDYTSQPAPVSSYPQGNPRSAFQPIQAPRKNTVRTSPSDTVPITTYTGTAHIMPTSSCLNRNLIGDNMLRYPEGVPVV